MLAAVNWRIDPIYKTVVCKESHTRVCVIMDVVNEDKRHNGSKTVPCGTPHVTKTYTDLTPSRTTR